MIHKTKFGFVILHYISLEMTNKCIENLLTHFAGHCIKIVIVDNASPNDSGRQLHNMYDRNPVVDVLINKQNLGYSRGNNIGYQYLNNQFAPDFMIVMNNDVLIYQSEFLEKIVEIHTRTNFDVLGPDIYSKRTKKHQNPDKIRLYSKEQAVHLYRQLEKKERHFAYCYYRDLIIGRIKRIFNKNNESLTKDYHREQYGVVLYGACYVFAKHFIEQRKLAFCPDTFLFFEEDILALECRRQGLSVLYSPKVRVDHFEDVSTDLLFPTRYRKGKMKNTEMLRSLGIFMRILDERVR